MKKICQYCGKEFKTYNKNRKYCSKECSSHSQECCHDITGDKEHIRYIWRNIKNRCYNPKISSYKDYGERGIKLCDDWKDSFAVFHDWAIQSGYKVGLTLDRIDVNGNYSPDNCRWVTSTTQTRNRRNTKYLEYNDEIKPLAEWAEIYHLPVDILYRRIQRGWNVEKALTTPKMKNKHTCSDEAFYRRGVKQPKPNKFCANCGKPFYSSRESAKFCSRECAFQNKRIREIKVCPICGNTFIPKRKGQKYCCLLCSSKGQQSVNDIYGNKKRLHSIWLNMKDRCFNPKNIRYSYYGGRGIAVCNEWKTSFKEFYTWANTHGYADDLSIDRINKDGNYTPENCRWANAKTQSNNRGNNRFITYKGVTKTIGQWANEIGVSWDTLAWRVEKGWSLDKALRKSF